MFGGVGFLLNGNMVCGVHKDDLVARVGPDEYEAALEKTGAGEFEITGRPMRGWVQVEAAAVESAAAMRKWIDLCHSFAESLPSK